MMFLSNWHGSKVIILLLFTCLLAKELLGNQHGRHNHHKRLRRTKRKHHDVNVRLKQAPKSASSLTMASSSTFYEVVKNDTDEPTTTASYSSDKAKTPTTEGITVETTSTEKLVATVNISLNSEKPINSTVSLAPNIETMTSSFNVKGKGNRRKRHKYKVISIQSGMIRGRVLKLEPNRKVYTYRGIPYGENTSGENRFKPPIPIKPWNSTKDVLEYPNTCYQWTDRSFDASYRKGFHGTMMWNPNTNLSEDCLYLNVWTPTNPRQSKDEMLSVMVWIYGGGFYSGTSSLAVYNGAWLASKQKVVVVSMNYRVAGLGFLALDDDRIRGNAGLLDQQLALKWVKDNIRYFGGDPNSVTLFGESAGAASIALHMMSEKSKGLFNNVILQSASSLSPWVVMDKKEAFRRAYKLAGALNCTPDSGDSKGSDTKKINKDVITCLQKTDPLTFVNTEIALESFGIARFPNAAVVDGNFLTISPFDEKSPAYWNTDVNVLAGFNANEGSYFIVYSTILQYDLNKENNIDEKAFLIGVKEAIRSMNGIDAAFNHTKEVLTTSSHFAYTSGYRPIFLPGKNKEAKGKSFIPTSEKYALHNDQRLQEDARMRAETFYKNRLDDLVGDISFVCPTISFLDKFNEQQEALNSTAPKKQTYLYKFVHRSSQNPWPEWMGVMHGYEIEFIFGLPHNKSLPYSDEEREISDSIMKMWADFAKYGDPNDRDGPEIWPPYNENKKYIFSIGEPGKDMKQWKSSLYSSKYSSQLTHCAFWEKHFPLIHKKLEAARDSKTCPMEPPSCPSRPSSCPSMGGTGFSIRYSLDVIVTMLLIVILKDNASF